MGTDPQLIVKTTPDGYRITAGMVDAATQYCFEFRGIKDKSAEPTLGMAARLEQKQAAMAAVAQRLIDLAIEANPNLNPDGTSALEVKELRQARLAQLFNATVYVAIGAAHAAMNPPQLRPDLTFVMQAGVTR